MRYRYLDDFRRGISVFAIFSYGIAVLGTPQCPPPWVRFEMHELLTTRVLFYSAQSKSIPSSMKNSRKRSKYRVQWQFIIVSGHGSYLKTKRLVKEFLKRIVW